MSQQPKPPEARSKRRGSENRLRQKQRCVRLTPAELDTLVIAAKRQRKTLATFLRDAGLQEARIQAGVDANAQATSAWLDDLARASLVTAEAKFGPMGGAP